MLAFLSASFLETAATYGWWLIWLTFFLSVIYARHDHRELSERIKNAAGKEQKDARRKRALVWLLPLVALVAASVAQLGSDKADKEIASLKKSLASVTNAPSQIARIQEKMRDRHISPEQRAKFIKSLEPAPKGKIEVYTYFNVDPGTDAYAKEINSMLQAAGYTPVGNDGIPTPTGLRGGVGHSLTSDQIPKGLFILVRNPTNQPPHAAFIQRAFTEIGLDAQGQTGFSFADVDDVIVIVVGLKP